MSGSSRDHKDDPRADPPGAQPAHGPDRAACDPSRLLMVRTSAAATGPAPDIQILRLGGQGETPRGTRQWQTAGGPGIDDEVNPLAG